MKSKNLLTVAGYAIGIAVIFSNIAPTFAGETQASTQAGFHDVAANQPNHTAILYLQSHGRVK